MNQLTSPTRQWPLNWSLEEHAWPGNTLIAQNMKDTMRWTTWLILVQARWIWWRLSRSRHPKKLEKNKKPLIRQYYRKKYIPVPSERRTEEGLIHLKGAGNNLTRYRCRTCHWTFRTWQYVLGRARLSPAYWRKLRVRLRNEGKPGKLKSISGFESFG